MRVLHTFRPAGAKHWVGAYYKHFAPLGLYTTSIKMDFQYRNNRQALLQKPYCP